MKHEMTDGIDVGVSNWIEIHTMMTTDCIRSIGTRDSLNQNPCQVDAY